MALSMHVDTALDSHQHFWRLRRGDYGWLTPNLTKLYRDFEPAHLEPVLRDCSIAQTILVQAAPTVEETRFLLQLAHQHKFIAGVVGWIDLESAHVDELLQELATDSKLVGVRPMVQDIQDSQWLLKASLAAGLRAVIECGLTFDALVRPLHLPTLLEFSQRYPELKIVLDHGAKPSIAANAFSSWARDVAQFARETSAYCKLSGLVTEAGSADLSVLAPYVEHLFECFGPERLLWGSDWPVCELVCSYEKWFEMSRALTAKLTTHQRNAVFGGNARVAYRLSEHVHAR